jgi:putative ATP-dependent endonuclease of OLD family
MGYVPPACSGIATVVRVKTMTTTSDGNQKRAPRKGAVTGTTSTQGVERTGEATRRAFISTVNYNNFRKLESGQLSLSPGLTIIAGENNSGKTAMVDGLRAILRKYTVAKTDLHAKLARAGADEAYTIDRSPNFLLELFVDDLSIEDQAHLIDALVASPNGTLRARIAAAGHLEDDDVITEPEIGSGSGGNIREITEQLNVVYLQPLRDPTSTQGLRSGRFSQIATLVRRFASDDEQKDLERVVDTANKELRLREPIVKAKEQLNHNLRQLSGADYSQEADLSFAEPEFGRLIASLEGLADGMNISLSGLGAANLYYVAAVLGDLRNDTKSRLRLLIIEEPEAHLHPHYQFLLLRFLQQTAEGSPAVQVIVTTHSPILASKAAAQSLAPIRVGEKGRIVASPVHLKADAVHQRRVKQYIDATRSELFFARRLILVEGDAELLLLPSLARRMQIALDEYGISVVSVAGLNFRIFIPFVRQDVLGIPVAILTDGDPPKIASPGAPTADKTESDEVDDHLYLGGNIDDGITKGSRYGSQLQTDFEGDPSISVHRSDVTLEIDLATPKANRSAMLQALEPLMSARRCANIVRAQANIDDERAWANSFYHETFEKRSISKAMFALELGSVLDSTTATFVIPQYIMGALNRMKKEATHSHGVTAPA